MILAHYHLAQANIGKIRGPIDGELMHGFTSRLDEINALAEAHEGFVWRLQDESGNATGIQEFDDPDLLINMSVWTSLETLRAFTFHSLHKELLRNRKKWFFPLDQVYSVLWWIPVGHEPAIVEAQTKLEWLQGHGPTPEAFTFKSSYPPPA